MKFFKDKKRYRVLYSDIYKPTFSWSIPMTKEQAIEYFYIFEEAIEVVEVIERKEMKNSAS